MPSSSLLRRTGDVFPPGRQRPSRKHPNKRLQEGQRRPKTPPMLTPTPRPRRLTPDASPMSTRRQRKRRTTTPTATIRSARGKHLGSPQPTNGQRHGSRDTSPRQQDHRHRQNEPRSSPAGAEGRKSPAATAKLHRPPAHQRTPVALRPRDRSTLEHKVGRGR
jgi:hypothetical protein